MERKLSPRSRMLLRWLWAAAFLVVIAGSLLPADSLPIRALSHLGVGDKLLHFAAYAVLAFLPTLHERWPALATALAVVVGTGVLLEFAQNYSPGRSFEIGDMVANTVGVLCGLVLGLPLRA